MTEQELIIKSEIPIEQKESIKIVKYAKNYGWEFRVFIENKDIKEALNKCVELNKELSSKFGTIENEN